MGSRGKMYWVNVINETVTAGSTLESKSINISGLENFSAVVDSVTGDFQIGYKASLTEDGTYLDTGTLLTASITDPAFLRFNPVIAPFIKITVTNNSGVSSGTISVTLIHRVP